jgi:hypothetical protein
MVEKEDEEMIYVTLFLIYMIFLCIVVLFMELGYLNENRSWKTIVNEIVDILTYRGRMRLWAHLVKIIMFSPCIICYYTYKYIKQLFIFLVYFK